MVNINFLPWREQLANYQQRQIRRLLISVIIISMVLILVMTIIVTQLEKSMQQHFNAKQHAWLVIKQMQANVHQPMQPVWQQQLLKHNELLTQLLVQLSNIAHPAICMLQIKQQQHAILFQGEVRSAADLTTFLQGFHLAPWFSLIKVEQLKQESHHQRFQLQAMVHQEVDEEHAL